MKAKISVKFKGKDKEQLPQELKCQTVVINNFQRKGNGNFFAEVKFNKDYKGLKDSQLESEIEKRLNNYIDNNSFDIELVDITLISKTTNTKDPAQQKNPAESFGTGGTVGKYKGFDNIYISNLPEDIQKDIRTVKAVAEGNISKLKTDTDIVKKHLAKIEAEPSDAEITKLVEKAKNHVVAKIKSDYGRAIKKTVKTIKKLDEKGVLDAQIGAYVTALEFSSGNKKKELETQIEAYKTALEFA